MQRTVRCLRGLPPLVLLAASCAPRPAAVPPAAAAPPEARVVVLGTGTPNADPDRSGPAAAVVAACAGCDVLVHEVYSAERFTTRPPAWQRYHESAHTSTVELARLATRAHPKLLVLYHQLYWGATDDDLVREIRAAGYTGAVVSARDLGVY